MTTATLANPGEARLSVRGALRSEWIKLRSLRSTWWCVALVIVLSTAFGALLALTGSRPAAGEVTLEAQQAALVQVATLGVTLTQLVVAVLGVLAIGGEYGTGMIRSTFSAVPSRPLAILAKAAVLAAFSFLLGALSIAVTAAVAWPLMAASGVTTAWLTPAVLLPMLGGAGYLALIALLAFSVGAVLRNSAGGIATILGVLLVLPTLLQLVAGRITWIMNVALVLPSSAGAKMFGYSAATGSAQAAADAARHGLLYLQPWAGALVLAAWAAVGLACAVVLTSRRDA